MQRIRVAVTLALVCLVSFSIPGSSPRAASPDIVISQVYGGGGNSGAPYKNDFIELYNRGSAPVFLGGWSLQYASATGTGNLGANSTQLTELPNVTLDPGQYYLVQEAAGAGTAAALPAPDLVDPTPINMSATAGKVALVTGIASLGCNGGSTPCSAAQLALIKDLVGFGSANFYEGAPTAAPSNTTAVLRKGNGATDTDNNAADFTVGAPNPRNSGIVVPPPPEPIAMAIHTIQGTGGASPYVGQPVITSGIVTARKANGFFLQAPDASTDADAATSEAIFVFTGGAPTASVGDEVQVTGTVSEFFNLTEVSATSVTLVAPLNPLPAAVALTPAILNPMGTSDQLERFEAMRVHADALVSVAPTNSFGEIEAVLGGVSRPMREPGIAQSLPVPPDPVSGLVDCCIPRWDENLERIMIDSDALLGLSAVTVTSNVTFTNVTGPLDFTFSRYKIAPEPPFTATTPNMTAVAVPAPAANEFTVAGYNIENFANAPTQRRKAALAIRDVMRLPDVIGTIEIANLATLQALAAEVNALAVNAGLPDPSYEAHLIPASPTATQNVGFLVKGSRVRVDDVTQEPVGEFVNPADGVTYLLHDRPPLVLRATLDPLGTSPENIIVVVNHPRSFIDVDLLTAEGARVREKRTKQAESIAALLQTLQTGNPKTPVIAVGDYNAYEFNDGYTDPVSVIKGTPRPGSQIVVSQSPDLVDPDFINLTDALPADQRYSFVFEGTTQALDHVFINSVAERIYQRYAVARNNADFPETSEFVNDATRPERNSDHDMPVAYFAFPGTPVVKLSGGASMTIEAYGAPFIDPGATASDDNGPLAVTVSGSVDVNTPGQYTLTYSASNFFHTTSITRTVTVADTTAPSIADFAVTPSWLWPPNHHMVDIAASYVASDASENSGGTIGCSIDVSSSEPQNGLGDGDTDVDWQVLSATALQLRAERSGLGTARVYTVAVTCTDSAGNSAARTATVTVPRNR